jgi:uncharacterized membrane protein
MIFNTFIVVRNSVVNEDSNILQTQKCSIMPLITNDAVVLGLLVVTLAAIFYTSKHRLFQKFYKYVPALLLCYFIPAIFNSSQLVDGEASALYKIASNYLLPASLVLLCLSIDLKGIINLGPKALIMFFTATFGIVIGGPIALFFVAQIQPQLLQPEVTIAAIDATNGGWSATLESANVVSKNDVLLYNDAVKLTADSIASSTFNETTSRYVTLVELAAPETELNQEIQLNPGTVLTNMNSEFWRGLSTISGSWIGGGANQTALKEISDTPTTQFSAMVIVDVFVANIWMAFLLFGAGMSVALDRRLKADSSAIDALRKKVEHYQASTARVSSFNDLAIILAFGFGGVAIAHLIADWAAPGLESYFANIQATNPSSFVAYLSSLETKFFWIIIVATFAGIGLSFTKARSYEGAGASKVGSVLLYVLVATIGMKMNIVELYENWGKYWAVILIGLVWMVVHITVLLIVAKVIKAPFFFVAVGSQANVGGAASAPIVASAFSPSLAPVGVLLAVLGYAIGTVGALLAMELMHALYL